MAGRHRRPPQRRRPGRHRRPPQRQRLVTPVLAGVVMLGLGGAGVAAAFTDNGPGSASPVPAAAPSAGPTDALPTDALPTDRLAPASSSAAAPVGSTVSASSPVQPDTAHIGFALTVTGRVAWVEIGVPGRTPIFQGMLRHGQTLRTPARPLHVVVGDAGAVRMVLHGYVHNPLGRPGQVLVFTVMR